MQSGTPETQAPGSAPGDDLIIAKAARRIIPYLILLYIFAFLDRVNVSFASLQMNADLGFSTTVYSIGASLFFVGYFFFEVPSNLALAKFGPRLWIARIMITWGVISTGMAFITGINSYYGMRFLLGVAEAGFFPGIVVYLGSWFPRPFRARITGLFMMAIPVSSLIGNPISGLLLDHMNGVGGFAGWQWMFLIEGVPAVLLGVSCLWLLPSRPADAVWLAPAERARLEAILAEERAGLERTRSYRLSEAFTNPGVLLLAGILYCVVFGITGIAFFLPQIIKSFGYSNTAVGFLSAVPYLCGATAMVLWSRRSDRKRERIGHIIAAILTGAAGFLLTTLFLDVHAVAMLGLVMAAVGLFAANPVVWSLPTSVMTGTAAAAAVALINSIANLSGVIGPPLLGKTVDMTGGFAAAGAIFTATLLVGAGLVLVFSRSRLAAGIQK